MRREKSRERKNNEEQWKKQCAEQWKQSEIRASGLRPVVMPSLNHSIFWLGERRSTEQHRRPGKTSPPS
jgi:hypothetical protein